MRSPQVLARIPIGLAIALGLVSSSCVSPQNGATTMPTPLPLPNLPTTRAPTPSAILTATPVVLPSQKISPTPSPSPTLTPKSFTYVFPVQPTSLASFSEGHSGYPATDIFAPKGTRFVAVTSGVVDFVSNEDNWKPAVDDPATRGGKSVAIIGDDGVRYYGSHLSSIAAGIAVGARVKAGETLGYVGNTGNARRLSGCLHFGISHPTTPDDWHTRRGEVDPYPYLLDWLMSVEITPRLP